MNTRWREIAVTCWEERLDGLHFDQEMFAELIVKECMEWCDAHATIDGSAQQIRNSIKNYFGVEE